MDRPVAYGALICAGSRTNRDWFVACGTLACTGHSNDCAFPALCAIYFFLFSFYFANLTIVIIIDASIVYGLV